MGAWKTVRKLSRAVGLSESYSIKKEDEELLETIQDNVALDAEATARQRELELEDLRFCDPATQWDDEDRKSREDAGRPVLTEDRLGPFLMQVCNEQRKNKPGGQVNPVDGTGDVETAEVIQGLIRHIEYNSNADTAYDTAFEWAVRCGRGFYRVCTDYVDAESFDQEILIKRVPNPHMVFVDPAAQEADLSDMKWGGFKAWMSRDDFERQYPKAEMAKASSGDWRAVGDDAEEWMQKDGGALMVVEYFYKEFTPSKVYRLADGSVVDTLPEGVEAVDQRDAIKTTVKWVKCTAVEILERGEFASKYIPIIAVLGKETLVEGQRTWAGLIRAGKDPQKRHNYLLTSQVERIAFQPISTWIGAKGFMGKEKKLWANAHKLPMAALEFEVIGDDGQTINRPELITQEASIRNVTEALVGAEEGLKAVLGMYDPTLGNREGSQSGLAIGRLQQQSETGNFHFQDNLSRAIRYECRIILDLIPHVYDTERVVRIIGDDESQDTVKINGPITAPQEAKGNAKEAIGRIYDLSTGKYDVTISAGPSYQSKRQEDRAMLLGMLQGPMGELVAQRAGDLVAKTLDSPIAIELAKRLIPPDIAKQDQANAQPLPPEVQQRMAQMDQMIQQLTGAVHAAHDQLESKQGDIDLAIKKVLLESDTKKEIALIQAQAGIEEARMKAAPADPLALQMLQDLQNRYEQLEGFVGQMHQVLASHPVLNPAGPPAGMEQQAPTAPDPGAQPQPPQDAGPMAGMEQSNA